MGELLLVQKGGRTFVYGTNHGGGGFGGGGGGGSGGDNGSGGLGEGRGRRGDRRKCTVGGMQQVGVLSGAAGAADAVLSAHGAVLAVAMASMSSSATAVTIATYDFQQHFSMGRTMELGRWGSEKTARIDIDQAMAQQAEAPIDRQKHCRLES